MTFLLALALLAPAMIYFTIAYFVFQFQVGFFFILALMGMFIVGTATYEYLQSRIWQYQTPISGAVLVSGLIVTIVATLLMVCQRTGGASVDEQIALTAILRLIMVGFFVFCSLLSNTLAHRPNVRKGLRIFFSACCLCLVALIVLLCWVPKLSLVYQFAFSAVAMAISCLNVASAIETNLHFHGKPFVLYRKIDGWEKSSSALQDVLFIVLPILFAVLQWL